MQQTFRQCMRLVVLFSIAVSFIWAQPAPPQPILLPVSTGVGCLIQSDFIRNGHGNFETVVLQGNDLVHYWHDNGNVQYTWVRGQVITHNATGPGCIIQSDFRGGSHGNFEVVVPEGRNLVHYFHDNGNVASPWQRGQIISTSSTGPATIIQSDFRGGDHGNFEVVVLEGANLVHYFHENNNVNNPWRRGQLISNHASSPGTIIQSDFRGGDHGNFEVLVREGTALVHYFHENNNVNNPWRRGQTVSMTPGGPAVMIQSDFHSGDHGNFEVLTIEGNSLVHYFHDNGNVANPWRRGQTVTSPATSVGGLLQSDFKGQHGNFEVAVFNRGQVTHLFHDNGNVNNAWQSGQVIAPSGRSQKVCQLTGETDFQYRGATKNHSQSRFSVGGTDLGYPFEHDGRLYFLFGDTAGSTGDGRDSIAYTRDADPEACPQLDWIADGSTFRPIQANSVSMAYFEVPSTGFSANGAMYVFVWTDHKDLFRKDAQGNEVFSNPLGHAALLRSDDQGRTFRLIWDRLGDKLIYLSSVVVNNEDVPGLPERTGQGLLIFGSGKYRASNPYLAYIPLNVVEQKSRVSYFTGIDTVTHQPKWGAETTATQLFNNPCVGELSVTWNRNLRQWMMLYNCDNPGGVVARVADKPWGPWSGPAVLFDAAVDAGTCYFLRGSADCGPATDPFSPANGGPGGVYGPYVIPRYTRGGPQNTTIYYVMSTWNPYQVVLMKSTLALHSPLSFGPDTCKSGFVWREAVPDDHVCVPPASRDAAAQQNHEAAGHRLPNGGPFGPDTCAQGFVWRDAFPGDHVCVTSAARQQVANDNAQGLSRRMAP
jgi:hypothetical protein